MGFKLNIKKKLTRWDFVDLDKFLTISSNLAWLILGIVFFLQKKKNYFNKIINL